MLLNDLNSELVSYQQQLKIVFHDSYSQNEFEEKEIIKIQKRLQSEKFDGDINLFLIKKCLKKNLDMTIDIEVYLFSNEFRTFSQNYKITKNEIINIFEELKQEKQNEFYESAVVKKIILDVRGELPITSARVYNIHLGLLTKSDGTEVSLEEYSRLCGEDLSVNKAILASAKKLVDLKVKRKLGLINA